VEQRSGSVLGNSLYILTVRSTLSDLWGALWTSNISSHNAQKKKN